MGRQPANTKLSSHVAVRRVRVRGGNYKFRALRLDHGTYSWGSEVSFQMVHLLGLCVYVMNVGRLAEGKQLTLSPVVRPFLQAISRKVRILDVVYNASNNELVSFNRTPHCAVPSRLLILCREPRAIV